MAAVASLSEDVQKANLRKQYRACLEPIWIEIAGQGNDNKE